MPTATLPAAKLAELVERVRKESHEASAKALVEHLWPVVSRIVRAHLPRRSSEEDLAQEVFMKMFSRIDQWRGQMPFDHWVSRIAVSTCLDALRHQKRRPELRWADLTENEVLALDRVRQEETSHNQQASLDARQLVNKLLETLKPTDRLILTMMDMEGRSVAEVKAVTGWSLTLIKVRAFRARRKLRQTLLQLEPDLNRSTADLS